MRTAIQASGRQFRHQKKSIRSDFEVYCPNEDSELIRPGPEKTVDGTYPLDTDETWDPVTRGPGFATLEHDKFADRNKVNDEVSFSEKFEIEDTQINLLDLVKDTDLFNQFCADRPSYPELEVEAPEDTVNIIVFTIPGPGNGSAQEMTCLILDPDNDIKMDGDTTYQNQKLINAHVRIDRTAGAHLSCLLAEAHANTQEQVNAIGCPSSMTLRSINEVRGMAAELLNRPVFWIKPVWDISDDNFLVRLCKLEKQLRAELVAWTNIPRSCEDPVNRAVGTIAGSEELFVGYRVMANYANVRMMVMRVMELAADHMVDRYGDIVAAAITPSFTGAKSVYWRV